MSNKFDEMNFDNMDYNTLPVVTITPEMAEWILDNLNKNNRALRKKTAQYYARLITDGDWKLSPFGIMFDENGQLLDGQHRLAACFWAKKPIQAIIYKNVPRSLMNIIDKVATRSLKDSIKLDPTIKLNGAEPDVSFVQFMMSPSEGLKQGHEKCRRFIEEFGAGIDWTSQKFQKNKLAGASIKAAVARAFYHYQHALPRLEQFVQTLLTGEGTIRETAALKLREQLQKVNFGTTGQAVQRTKYYTTERLIQAFMIKKEVRKVEFYTSGELFKLDGYDPDEDNESNSAKTMY